MKLSRPIQIVLAVLVLVALVVVVVLLLPALTPAPAPTTKLAAQSGPTRTPHPWSISAGPSPTPHPWSIAGGPSPTPLGAPPGTVVAVGGTTTYTNPLPQGGGETLPPTASGLPWLIPVGAVLLLAIVWWRWRRARASG